MKQRKCNRCNEVKNLTEFKLAQQKTYLKNGTPTFHLYPLRYCIKCTKKKGGDMRSESAKNKNKKVTEEIFIDKMIKFAKSKGYKHLSHARDVIGLKELKRMYNEEIKL